MEKDVLIGVDVGTTNCKAVAYSIDGAKIIEYSVEYPTYHPKPLWAEQDPNDWVKAFIKSTREVIAYLKKRGYIVKAICTTSQREGVVPVDKNGRPLARCIIWMDERSTPQAEKIEKDAKVSLRPDEKEHVINAAAGMAYRAVMEQVRTEFYKIFDGAKERIGEVAL